MPTPTVNPQNIRIAIFDCPEKLSEAQLQEIQNFAEYISAQQKPEQK